MAPTKLSFMYGFLLTGLMAFVLSGFSFAQSHILPLFDTRGQINEHIWYISHGWANAHWQSCEWRKEALSQENNTLVITLSPKAAEKRPISCGEIQSRETFHYGRYEARLKAASGRGLNTAFFTYTGPPHGNKIHDEIDFEILGKNTRRVDITYWHNGKQAKVQKIDLGFDAATSFNTYAFEWRKDSLKWFINDKLVYETPEDTDIPDQPSKIFLSLWSGGPEKKDWLGIFTYEEPKQAHIQWVKFTPFSEET